MWRMPFGKHKGKLLSEVPEMYLQWLLWECTSLRPPLRDAVTEELRRRAAAPSETEEPPRQQALVDVRSAAQSWYREMAKRYHPDRTLDNGKCMAAINDAYQRLRELLRLDAR